VPQPRLRLRLTAAAESAVRSGHPWVYANSIREQNRDGTAGELAVIYNRSDRFLGAGLFDPESVLRVRMLHVGQPIQIDDQWWEARLQTSIARRSGILDTKTTACRLINGESDGWPGLVLDQYGNSFVLKLYTVAWSSRMDLLLKLLDQTFHPENIVLRLSRNVQQFFAGQNYRDGQTILGAPVNAPVIFLETGLRFEADVVAGQKTGFFLDQRENRREVEKLARDRTVLNAFSFSGGFSLYAARGGARSVTDLDISSHALASARRNFELNRADANIARCRHETIQADAFEWLEHQPIPKFDLIVLDPPSLAKRETEREGAIRAYEKLATGALTKLREGGVLVAASCSAHVSADQFFGAIERAAMKSGRRFNIFNRTRHAVDHPATFPEAEYLKCIYVRFDS
jgi:23S rRNA (cytosine1962-C5)-methyltransferase